MRKRILGLVAATVLSLPALGQSTDYPQLPLSRFPGGDSVTLSDLPDKPTYLKFWATWCKPCMKQMPHFEKIARQYGDTLNIVGVNINVNETDARIQEVVERFGLSMPVWLDDEGALGSALGLVGTPYSVLLDADERVLYTTHKADKALDKRLAVLASTKGSSLQAVTLPTADEARQHMARWKEGEHLLFFSATWCASYLADTRPAMAERCDKAQKNLASLYQQFPELPWHGIANHLWTDKQALKAFTDTYQIPFEFSVDTRGVLFNHYQVRDIPALIWIEDGKIKQRFSNLTDKDAVARQLQNR